MMKRLLIMCLALLWLSGCASVSQTPIPECKAKACMTEYRGKVYLAGGGRHAVTLLTVVGKDGSQNARPIVDSAFPDRLDTWGPSALMGFAQYQSAARNARAIEHSSKSRGPSQVFVLAPEGGDAQAITNTEVGVATNQELGLGLQPVHFCNTCNQGN